MKRVCTLIAGFGLALAISAPATADDHGDKMAAAIDNAWRTDEQKARDIYRHPAETLAFFGIKPDMTIVELNPGGGWYTNILAPMVKDDGRYIGVEYDPKIWAEEAPNFAKRLEDYPATVKANPDKYGANAHGTWILDGDIAPDGSVDMVLGIRFIHGWISRGFADQALAKLHRTMKPGATFAVVQHRASEDDPRPPAELARTGYVKQSYMVELMENHGFELVAASEVNANPKDTKDHPSGVWTLPPVLTLGDEDRDKYLAIGESDRMTLKFVKPAG